MNRIWSIPICLCMVALFGIQDSYAYEKAYRVRNNSLNSRRGLYFAIVGTGEQATLEVKENPHGCPIPNVTVMGSSAWIISWVVTCVPPGESVVVKITTAGTEGNEFSDGHWMPGDVPVQPGDVETIGLATVQNTNFINRDTSKKLSETALIPKHHWMKYANPRDAGFSLEKLEKARRYWDSTQSAACMIVHDGAVVAAWGEIERRFMCHSVRKSLLSALYGIYVDPGVIDTKKKARGNGNR